VGTGYSADGSKFGTGRQNISWAVGRLASAQRPQIPAWARLLDVPTNRHRELLEGMRHTLARLKIAAEADTGAAEAVGKENE